MRVSHAEGAGLHDTCIPLSPLPEIKSSRGTGSQQVSPVGWGGESNQFHLLGPEKPPEKVDLEMRGRVFQVEGMACAKAQRNERAKVFLQEGASAMLEVGSSVECR